MPGIARESCALHERVLTYLGLLAEGGQAARAVLVGHTRSNETPRIQTL